MKSNCIWCGIEYDKIKNIKTCCKEHSLLYKEKYLVSEKRKQLLKLNHKVNYDRMKLKSEELGVPIHIIYTYGYSFLKENTLVLEALKIAQLMVGKKNIPEDVKLARKKLRIKSIDIYNRNKKPTYIKCVICGDLFIRKARRKCCGKQECTKTLYNKSRKTIKN